jgi:hypothetical protein
LFACTVMYIPQQHSLNGVEVEHAVHWPRGATS